MHMTRLALCGLVAAVGFPWCATTATAAALPAATLASQSRATPIEVGGHWYRDDYDDDDGDYYYPPEYYLPPPPPPVRVYRYAPPPVVEYEPPVYGWIAPPRPSNCGKYRYWNGDRCADARYDPPYVGPRW
jgi:hypothetical protein